jgi:superfamily II DNA or RNA helicase
MRVIIKNKLINKEVRCVIATTVWREGIDIPSLDCVINAAGGKSEIMTLQGVGRGLRKTD